MLIIPTIGASGYYQLRVPMDALMVPNARYTCKAIRKLSDYIANNEDPKKDIYLAYSLPEAEYDQDIAVDMSIVSLQSDQGHWLYVPARYLIDQPVTNGIPYRAITIAASLPSMPVDRDLTFLQNEVSNLIMDSLGVVPEVGFVETSRVVLVSREKHDLVQTERNVVSGGRVTDRSRYQNLLIQHQAALDKITALEDYIKTHLNLN